MTLPKMISHASKPYYITGDYEALDLNALHDYLSNVAYWCLGIPIETVQKAWKNSLTFGLMTSGGVMVGGARVVTDKATYAYLADVYILDEHQGQGLGIWLVETIMAHPELQTIRRFLLATSNMHSLYEKFGFSELSQPDMIMEKLGSNYLIR